MSTSGAGVFAAGDQVVVRHAARIAGGIALPFVLGELLDWTAPFLISIFALQLLAVRQPPLTLRAAFTSVVAVAAAFGASILLTALVRGYPGVFLVGIGLAVFGGLYGQARNGSPFWFILLIAVTATPLLASASEGVAVTFARLAVLAMLAAVATAWLMHAAFPDPADAPPPGPPPTMDAGAAAHAALVGTLVLMPLLLLLLSNNSAAVVVMVTALTLLKASSSSEGTRTALGLLAANGVAGAIAIAAYAVLVAAPTVPMLVAVVAAVSLALAGHVALGGQQGALAAAASAAAILLIGMGLSPFTDSTTAFVSRLVNVLLASVYTMGAWFVLEQFTSRRS